MKSQIPLITDIIDPEVKTALKRVSFTPKQIIALMLIYKNLPQPKSTKNQQIPLDLIEAKQRYNLSISNTHYQYSGYMPNRNGVEMVRVNNNPVYSIDTSQNPDVVITTRTRELINGHVQEMYKQQPPGFKGILPLGSRITVAENTDLEIYDGESATNPVAIMSEAIDQYISELSKSDQERIKSIEIFDFLNELQNLDELIGDNKVIIGFGNDLGNSQQSTIEEVQHAGSNLIDNCAEISDLTVADGGDGSEGSALIKMSDINSLIMFSAYRDGKAVDGTALSVRSAYLALNPKRLLELAPSSTSENNLELLHKLATSLASILQSTIKEVEDNKNDKSAIVLTQQLASSLAFQGNNSIVKGSVPVTKQSPAYYSSSTESTSLVEHNSLLNIVTLDTANIHFDNRPLE
jgi:hypothetical protein